MPFGFSVILIYNIFQIINVSDVDITSQYKRAYNIDTFYLEHNKQLNKDENYEKIVERIHLEKYAIDNNIKYNILINSQNESAILPPDARILLMKVFDNFEVLIIFIIIYLSCTIISEEYYSGTIKNILIKPYKRVKILFSKILTDFLIIILVVLILVIFQYVLGGLLFGFESYSLDAIRYNTISQDIETMNLVKYILLLFTTKIFMYVILSSFSLLFGIITNNMALNILISLGAYFWSTFEILKNNITNYIFIYNWDISKYLFTDSTMLWQSIIISSISLLIFLLLIIIIFNKKDVRNI